MDTRTECRCWRALAGGGVLVAVLVGCGGGEPEGPASGTGVAVAAAPGFGPAALATPPTPPTPAPMAQPQHTLAAAPCDRVAAVQPPHGAQAALHAEQQATDSAFDALATMSRQQHAGTTTLDDPAEPR